MTQNTGVLIPSCTNMLQIMVHGLGHSLGLSHSDVRDAVMAPVYRKWDPFLKLIADDRRAIQSLYGQKVNKQPPRGRSTTSRPNIFQPLNQSDSVNICTNPKIDGIVQTADTTSYIFQADNYWKLTSDSVAPGYPRKIAQDWPTLPSNIDAAFTWQNSTYFLKGYKYWKFQNRTPKPGYPKDIKDGFPGIPTGVDVSFVWGGNGKIYIFKGS
jgi:matrix metalloproteinase-14 (membrane-inserted)